MRAILFLILVTSLALPTFAQEKAMKATRKQKTKLEPMIETLSRSFMLHSANLDRKKVERQLWGALGVQASFKAGKRFKAEYAEILAEELDIETPEGIRVAGRYYGKLFGRGPTESEQALIIIPLPPYPETSDEAERMRVEKEREVVRGRQMEVQRHVDTLPFPPFSIESTHKKCVFHDKLAQIDMKSELEKELEKEQRRGMKEMAMHYAPQLAAVFDSTSDKHFQGAIEEALNHHHTSHSLFAVLVKVRRFARPQVYAEKSIGFDDPKAICEAQADVIEHVCKTMKDAKVWSALRSDHELMIEDARAFRKVLKARIKGK
jgi:hypothetical protein